MFLPICVIILSKDVFGTVGSKAKTTQKRQVIKLNAARCPSMSCASNTRLLKLSTNMQYDRCGLVIAPQSSKRTLRA
eukprot:6404865-Amphidinium_carterae.1